MPWITLLSDVDNIDFLNVIEGRNEEFGGEMKKFILGTIFLALATAIPIRTLAGVNVNMGITTPAT
jgi:hypothetical protein